MENPVPAVVIHDLTVSYDRRPVLWNVDLAIPVGTLTGVIGPNGAGKSTLLKAIMELLPKSSGYVRLFDQPLSGVRHLVSYVPQRESVDWDFPASALDIVLMGRYGKVGVGKRLRQADREVALECLRKVGMEAYAGRQISQLSGGQQQRVFLARALAQDARLYLLDEPFAGVDIATEGAIIALLREMKAAGKTIVVVHHDLQSATEYFDQVILLNVRLVAHGPTETILTPEKLQETYGGKLTVLAKAGELLQKSQFPARE